MLLRIQVVGCYTLCGERCPTFWRVLIPLYLASDSISAGTKASLSPETSGTTQRCCWGFNFSGEWCPKFQRVVIHSSLPSNSISSEDEGIRIFRNVGNHSPNDTASHAKRLGSKRLNWLGTFSLIFSTENYHKDAVRCPRVASRLHKDGRTDVRNSISLLKTKLNLLYIWNQSVPRCKHFPPRLLKPVS
jgi:hypothetical protein